MEMLMAVETDRLDLRITPEKKRLIERAALASGQTLTQFARTALYREARKVLKREQMLILSDRDRDAFLAALDSPPPPNQKLVKAARRLREARDTGQIR